MVSGDYDLETGVDVFVGEFGETIRRSLPCGECTLSIDCILSLQGNYGTFIISNLNIKKSSSIVVIFKTYTN